MPGNEILGIKLKIQLLNNFYLDYCKTPWW